jgi:copper(I)-binding protein
MAIYRMHRRNRKECEGKKALRTTVGSFGISRTGLLRLGALLLGMLMITMLMPLTAIAGNAARPVINEAWMPEVLAEQKMGVVYLTITNPTGKDDALIAAESPIAQEIKFYTHSRTRDIVHTRPLPAYLLPKGEKREMKPGADHLLLLQLKNKPMNGSRFPLILVFREAGRMRVNVEVRTPDFDSIEPAAGNVVVPMIIP